MQVDFGLKGLSGGFTMRKSLGWCSSTKERSSVPDIDTCNIYKYQITYAFFGKLYELQILNSIFKVL